MPFIRVKGQSVLSPSTLVLPREGIWVERLPFWVCAEATPLGPEALTVPEALLGPGVSPEPSVWTENCKAICVGVQNPICKLKFEF